MLVAPYIPGMLQPREMDYIIQNMQFNNVKNLEAIKNEISNKLTRVYVNAQLNGVQKRRKRALGSIDAVVSISWQYLKDIEREIERAIDIMRNDVTRRDIRGRFWS